MNTSIITPEMIGHYREFLARKHWVADWLDDKAAFGGTLYADPEMYPFIVQFHKRNGIHHNETAYLAVIDGEVQWRHTYNVTGYQYCPIVDDQYLIERLDAIFARYYAKHGLPGALTDLEEPLGSWNRLEWTGAKFFGDQQPGDPTSLFPEHVVAELIVWDGIRSFLRVFSSSLYKDENHLSTKWVGPGKDRKRVLAMQYRAKTQYIDVAMPGNLVRQVLLSLNHVLWPDYEIRRCLDGFTGCGSMLLPMSPMDWERLEALHGRDAVAEKFEKITDRTVVDIHTDERGHDLEIY